MKVLEDTFKLSTRRRPMIVKLQTSRRFVCSSSGHRVQVVELAARVVREHGLPDLVVNNAGCYYIQHFRCEK